VSTPFFCVLLAGLLPYAATLVAKVGDRTFDNGEPRAWLAQRQGYRSRANAAQLNGFEAFPLFAAAVVIAHLRSTDLKTVATLSVAFVVARVLYTALYIANLAALRSIVWFAGLGCSVALFFVG
jgi:uncharacterized MAPEG superfamily protein